MNEQSGPPVCKKCLVIMNYLYHQILKAQVWECPVCKHCGECPETRLQSFPENVRKKIAENSQKIS